MTPSSETTQVLDREDRAIFDKYVALLASIRGPVSVWATTDEGILHFYTLAPKGEERAVFDAELNLMRAIDPVLVDFDVHIHPEYVHEFLFKNEPPLFHRD
jgi:hypothetical protein